MLWDSPVEVLFEASVTEQMIPMEQIQSIVPHTDARERHYADSGWEVMFLDGQIYLITSYL